MSGPALSAPDAPSPSAPADPPGPPRTALPLRLAAAALAGGAVLALDLLGLWRGPVGIVAVAAALLAVPVARGAAGRVSIMGVLILGWWPLTWWVALPEQVSRVGLGLAAVAAVLAWCATRGDVRRLLPRWAATDAVWVGAGAFTAWMHLPWLAPGSSAAALRLMLPGWDHSAHLNMTAMMRRFGTVIAQAPPAPAGDTWSYPDYPQFPHTVLATLLDLARGPATATDPADYTRAVGLLAVGLVATAVAGAVALPWLRTRWWAAAPAGAVVTATLVLGPGGTMLRDGFPPYLVVLALLATLPFLVLPAGRVVDPVRLAAIGGALMGVAHGWTLGLALALPMVLVLLVPPRRERWSARPAAWVAAAAVVAVTAAVGIGGYLMVAAGVPLADMVGISGGITGVRSGVLIAVGAVCGLATAALALGARRRGDEVMARAGALVGVPIAAAGVGLWIVAHQPTVLPFGYYFLKFAVAAAVAMAATTVAALSTLVRGRPERQDAAEPPRRPAARGQVVFGALGTVAGLVVFGLPVPGTPFLAPGGVTRVGDAALLADEGALRDTSEAILAAAASEVPVPGRQVVLLPTDALPGIQGAQWVNALTGRWTDQANGLLRLLPAWDVLGGFAAVAPDVLADPDTVVLVPPDRVADLRAGLPPEDAGRVLGW